ncbi:mannitol-1-phosphate 5-dehydrogenase [Heyndrickxia coagulans]|uniref:Mannitol-1-phosphate 5-dehydrogenase n=1 Tax=Heyndrickxia coagulans TaxID=1398 RepID=A0A150KDT3_HEYCO|nr:mannitol-1-phosphate 5-dehydrogenase [Heyndrickxia coagulans]KYC67859.1 Mannitol-1-phosphate 5-dehydrogenase [Heyndrickxia coagulans]
MKQAVHFGAGNIGRGFIGALFSKSGYKVTFVDVAGRIIDALNAKKEYLVISADENQTAEKIQHVSGINSREHPEDVVEAIKNATYLTTAVGVKVLPVIAPLIAKGIEARLRGSSEGKLYVIACENQIAATDFLKKHVLRYLNEMDAENMDNAVAFLNCAVDRIVPVQSHHQLLDVLVEPYYEWVVEANEKLPEVEGMGIVANITPYIERKLFTVNTGHAVTAYIGYLAGKKTIDQALGDLDIYQAVKKTVDETGNYLIQKFGLNRREHEKYISKILERFQNKYFKDDVTRVGRSPIRKLGPEDRLIKPAIEAKKLGLPFTHLSSAIATCLRFDVKTDPEAVELQKQLKEYGVREVLHRISKLEKDDPITLEVAHSYEQMEMLV